MTILVDASALVAMATKEPEAHRLAALLDRHDERLFCPTGEWEATLAIARKRTAPLAEAQEELRTLMGQLGLMPVPIGADETDAALAAHARYGKGSGHPARLNMGDCFAYACAKANAAELLYKGDDFAHTDLA